MFCQPMMLISTFHFIFKFWYGENEFESDRERYDKFGKLIACWKWNWNLCQNENEFERRSNLFQATFFCLFFFHDNRNNEKRKEKSRDAARCRRSRETEIFTELGETLPVRKDELENLDKSSVMRLAIATLKIEDMLQLCELD